MQHFEFALQHWIKTYLGLAEKVFYEFWEG
jgi:hypothetical protein